jgi:hypothetical protein
MTTETVTIKAPEFGTALFQIIGTAPLVVNKFPAKARQIMRDKQAAGAQSKKGGAREAKDFEACFHGARHLSREGWDGICASSFRHAMVDACKLVGFKMTLAKLALFIEPDGFDADEGTPLVKIISKSQPKVLEMAVRNQTGVADIRVRPQWEEWGCALRVRFDKTIFSLSDITNLVARAGQQCGICEGRPNSKESVGMGWGTFEIKGAESKRKAA